MILGTLLAVAITLALFGLACDAVTLATNRKKPVKRTYPARFRPTMAERRTR